MRIKLIQLNFLLLASLILFVSCQKEVDGTIAGVTPPVEQKPRVGTVWTYYYYYVNHQGGPTHSKLLKYKAVSEETLGGEKWLKIVDIETDTLVYYMNTKTDGLYQYVNNSANLLCKDPAVVGDTYTTYNGGGTELFTVRGVNDTTATGIGNIPLSKYEGVKDNYIIDLVWYNKKAWIVWKNRYKKNVFPTGVEYYLFNRMFIDNIVY